MNELEVKIGLRLYAIAYECKHNKIVTLKGILSAEDAINRSAPTHIELENELNELFSMNLIKPVEKGYVVTSKGNSYYKRANEINGNIFGRLDYLRKLLIEENREIVRVDTISIDHTEFSRAYQAYYGGEYKF